MTTRSHTRAAAEGIDKREADRIAGHILALVTRIVAAHEARRELWPDAVRRGRQRWTTCYGCGCLVVPTEHCPGCKARKAAA